MRQAPTLVAHGLAFDCDQPYTYCRLCGALYQNEAIERRRLWSFLHARRHPTREHTLLAKSGRWLMPDAAYKLAAYGVIDIIGLAVDDEVSAAYYESPSTPNHC